MDSCTSRTKSDASEGMGNKRRAGKRGRDLVGSYVKKDFPGIGIFLGKVVKYDGGLYRIDYEDGDCEDLDYRELCEFLVDNNELEKAEFGVRKRKLDEFVLAGDSEVPRKKSRRNPVVSESKLRTDSENGSDNVPQLDISRKDSQRDCNEDGEREPQFSSYSSCSPIENPPMEPLPLPPSSGDIDIPDESVPFLFSVYNFLRSFSHRLFLSPFSLDDFVGALNCISENSLLSAIHLCLMRALRHHLQTASPEANELASKCLRRLDWDLLDALTWPVYLLEYLLASGFSIRLMPDGFYLSVINGGYYSLPVPAKLKTLQILCDSILESAEIRAELNMRESAEVETESEETSTLLSESGPRRVHPRYSKTSACKDPEVMKTMVENFEAKVNNQNASHPQPTNLVENLPNPFDGNSDECRLCSMDGMLVCCDGCPLAYHSRCIGVNKALLPEGLWFCPECTVNKVDSNCSRIGMGLKGAEIFGIDPYQQMFLGTCNYLLVTKISLDDGESICKYYNQHDVPKVLELLSSNEQYISWYSHICKQIIQYWLMPDDSSLIHSAKNETEIDRMDGKGDESMSDSSCTLSISVEKLVNTTQVQSNAIAANKEASPSERNKAGLNASSKSLIHLTIPDTIQGNGFIFEELSIKKEVGVLDKIGNVPPNHPFNSNHKVVEAGVHGGYRGTNFKPQAYTNMYVHGDVAASAAANLTLLASDESRIPELHTCSNPKKMVSANITLQLKAFSGVVMQFSWPCSEKKLIEVPRERCGWCLSCKGANTSKKGCLLNFAALNALKGPAKVLGGLRTMKNGEGHLSAIAAYLLHMEEALHGLVVGPFLIENNRRQWRKLVDQASSCSILKFLLLKFEENIRSVVMSGGWVKLMDDWLSEFPPIQNASSFIVSSQKRGPGGRRRRMPTAPDMVLDSYHISSKDFCWQRGGKLNKLVFQKGLVTTSGIKKVARGGGSKKILGIHYVEGSIAPKRNYQLAWRAAVEMCRNASHLALQVRYLDAHIRWNDLIHPDQLSQEIKASEIEASAFRNAAICDKKEMGGKVAYALAFGNQKHLPSRVMKNIIQTDKDQDGKEKIWFSENHIPLYLIKEYEEKARKDALQPSTQTLKFLSELWLKKLKDFRGGVFFYLTHKGDTLGKCTLASCQGDVQLWNSVKCSSCQDFCHKDCSTPIITDNRGNLEFEFSCKYCQTKCQQTKSIVSDEKKLVHFPLQGKRHINANQQNGHLTPLLSSKKMECNSVTKTSSSKSGIAGSTAFGLIWKKKKNQEFGTNFRLKNILLRNNGTFDTKIGPTCCLCLQPYNPTFMYIRCESCSNWYHADAIQLNESQIFDVEGFKCCKCRRKLSPTCPYMKPELKQLQLKTPKFLIKDVQKPSINKLPAAFINEIDQCNTAGMSLSSFPTKVENDFVQTDDPLLCSIEKVDPVPICSSEPSSGWNTGGGTYQNPKKLPVRRNIKHEKEDCCPTNILPKEGDFSVQNNISVQLDWGLPESGIGEESVETVPWNIDEIEFEPQTFLSFTELLASDEGQLCDLFNVHQNWYNSSGCDNTTLNDMAVLSNDQQDGVGSMQNHEDAFSNDAMIHTDLSARAEPPDIYCDVCGNLIHSFCSPWVEPSSYDGKWWCGRCRDWR